jgi:hypothetical protein
MTTQNKTGHTPTPWKAYNAYVESDRGLVANCTNKQMGNPMTTEETYANTKLIVRAVNSHEALVNACKYLLTRVSYPIDFNPIKDVLDLIEISEGK